MQTESINDKIISAITIGIFIFSIMYNFFLYRFTKDKSIKYLTLCILFLTISFFPGKSIIPSSRIIWYINPLIDILINYFIATFYIKFIIFFSLENEGGIIFDIKKTIKKVRVFYTFLLAFFIFIFFFEQLDNLIIFLVQASQLLILMLIFYVFVKFLKYRLYKRHGFRFIVLGKLILFIGFSINLVSIVRQAVLIAKYNEASIVLTNFLHYSTELSIILFISFLSISIADKINHLKIEKEQAQENALLILEEKVQERTLEVVSQKHIVEEKHKEITDSINYAERIQRSFIATKEILDQNLKDYFVLFKPKDVVSGDFYWVGKLNNGNFALATADSTGHGVPGAIMSLLNITSLEKAIETLTNPSDILNATRKTIIERLKKDGSEHGGKDGMDASLTVYDFKNRKLIISAANNPVWIVRGKETIDIKADKMPVGKHDKDNVSFTQQEIDLQSGDVVYTLTDGFPDQFGGEKGKKFMSKSLRELLAANAHLPMPEQKQLLEKTFAEWVGNLEQVDDVTLIGVRI